MTQKKIISSFAVALFSTIFVGGIFYLTDNRFKTAEDERMFSWGFVIIYFSGMFTVSLFADKLMGFFKKNQ
ncbi:hypothetical protein ASG31_00355 [Chryseobacterium sp. Leaf404]|uniref:hypothetical protein n=1 Tax=unclassified Chryseobacterium TaxID=2593645 RepID=UPI0006F7D164|nr:MULTISPECIES: hypothetical protein [unclassified Chryseobacterium]KQT21833.1 hypothetical protein ASG31_00355 [Chryseobacterium sp. Leaf404]